MKRPRKTRPAPWMEAAGAKKRRSKRARELEQYRKRARQVVQEARRRHVKCPVTYGLVEEVHHLNGRAGKLLLDERYWLLVSAKGHAFIHRNMSYARTQGWLCEKGKWNTTE